MSIFLLSSLACLGGAVGTIVDGRRAVGIAAAAVGLALTPCAAEIAGDRATVALLGAAAVALLAGAAMRAAGAWLRVGPSLDPLLPLFAPPNQLFGPRSTRVAGAAVVLPLASWVSLNIAVGGATTVAGLLFPAAYVGLCAAVRVIAARTLEDIGVALVLGCYAAATGWLIADGAQGFGDVVLVLLPVPATAAVIGWFAGRSRRPRVGASA